VATAPIDTGWEIARSTMAEDESTSEPAGAARSEPPPAESIEPRRSFIRRHWGKLAIVALVFVPALVFTIWAGVTLSYSYSSGERVGYVQKLSRKGWLCKTWEGELQLSNIPGSAPILFQFSIRSDSLASAIEAMAGHQVSLHYEQHVGVPTSCFAETEYFVTAARDLGRP
jgi:hypothetical protein